MRRVQEVMGMPITVNVGDDQARAEAVDAVFDNFTLMCAKTAT